MENDAAAASPGSILSRERIRQNLTVSEVASKLRLSVRQVEALEADQYDKLPGATFIRGFLRNYARLLQLDPEPLVAATGIESSSSSGPVIDAPSQNIRFSPSHRASNSRLWVASLVILALAVLAGLLLRRQPEPPAVTGAPTETVVALPSATEANSSAPASQPTQAAATSVSGSSGTATPANPTPAASTPAPALPPIAVTEPIPASTPRASAKPAPAPEEAAEDTTEFATPAKLRFHFNGESWVEIRDRRGRIVYSKLNSAGDFDEVEVRGPVRLIVGNAADVTMTYNDQAFDLAPYIRVKVARFSIP